MTGFAYRVRPRGRLRAALRRSGVVAAAASLVACAGGPDPGRGAILAIGDSVMAWNGDAGIPEVLSAALQRPVRDAAQSLARVRQPNPVAARLGFDIARQWRTNRGPWGWVVLTGGANDLRPFCETPEAQTALDALAGPGGGGALFELVARIRATGAGVAYVGYYDGRVGAETGFTPCQPLFDVLTARMAAVARGDPGLIVLDASDVIDPTDPSLYAADDNHPSVEGSRRIGTALAARIAAADGS